MGIRWSFIGKGALIGAAVYVPVILLVAHSGQQVASATGSSPAQRSAAKDEVKQPDDDPLAGVHQWYAYLDGNKIACYVDQAGQHRWFIVLPTPAQRAVGEVMVTNDNPSDDAWNMSCSKQPVIGHW